MRGLLILVVLFAVSAWQHPHVADPIMKKAHAQYVNEQYLFPVVKGVQSDKELVQGLQKNYIDVGKVGFYPEELFQSASDVGSIVQRFLQNGDQDTFLTSLNSAYAAK